METISMSTKSLRDILRKTSERDLGIRILLAEDAHGPGGNVFITARSELNERHLNWLERRNPAPGAQTYIEVVFARDQSGDVSPIEIAPETSTRANQQRKRANELSQQVGQRAEDVVRQASQVHRLVGDGLFASGALKNPKIRENLTDLENRLHNFHSAVHAALDEYVEGNSLIMDLIAQFDPGVRAVTHGLNVAVLASEIAVPVFVEENEGTSEALKRDLAEVFVGGFLHDCGLWGESSGEEAHEALGARLIHQVPVLRDLAPDLLSILLFHSDALRMAHRAALVLCLFNEGDPARLRFSGECYANVDDARRAAKQRGDGAHASILQQKDLRKILPVAIAEYCITQTEGFHARTLSEAITRLAREVEGSLYSRFLTVLCNTQLQPIAPRRAYVSFSGRIQLPTHGNPLEMSHYSGGSLLHGNDPYSPHIVLLSTTNGNGSNQKLQYIDPRSPDFWARRSAPPQRFYVPVGRYKSELALTVTGFMGEATFSNILGEYEAALRAQGQI
ncbi:MAG: hypothetical protein ACI8PG_004853 [Planctomycetota bacterium]|jgi:hypothetical protein